MSRILKDVMLQKLVCKHERIVLRVVMSSRVSVIAARIVDIRSWLGPSLSSRNRIYITYYSWRYMDRCVLDYRYVTNEWIGWLDLGWRACPTGWLLVMEELKVYIEF